MSRKRKLKKQVKRRARWIENLEDLYLRQADEAFLEAARPHFQGLDDAALSGMYDEVVDRAFAGALTGGDPARVGKLLTRIRHDDTPRPLVLLAEAVDLLAKGRHEPAAARLAALGDMDEAALGVARRLPEKLRELTRGVGELEDPAARTVRDFYRALAAVGRRSFRPGAKTLATLAQAVAALRKGGPIDRPRSCLLRETEKRLRALTNLRQLEQSMRRRRGVGPIEDFLLQRLDTTGLSAKLLLDNPPALLRPLQHALRSRWRDVLELIFERRGGGGLATLFAARPELLAADLDPGSGVADVRRWAEVKALLESKSFGELATLLRSAGTRAASTGQLASLWSLELWARLKDTEEMEFGQAHATLVRLIEMATAISGRFSASDRPRVAHVLRDELFDVCAVLDVCEHFLDAAQALLTHLDDDPGLLAIALAGAVSSRDDRTRREITARLSARVPTRTDQQALLRLAESVAAERPRIAVPVLTAQRPLFTDSSWSDLLDRVAPEAVNGMRGGLVEAGDFAVEEPEEAEWILGEVRQDLELYRPLLGGRSELATLELAIEYWGATPATAELLARNFLSRFEGLEPALQLYRQALQLGDAEVFPEINATLVEAVVDRLDPRWRLWMPCLLPLVVDATAKQIRKLRSKIRRFRKDPALDEKDRRALRHILERIEEIRGSKRHGRQPTVFGADVAPPGLETPEEPEPKLKKPHARRPRPVDDRQLDLFALE